MITRRSNEAFCETGWNLRGSDGLSSCADGGDPVSIADERRWILKLSRDGGYELAWTTESKTEGWWLSADQVETMFAEWQASRKPEARTYAELMLSPLSPLAQPEAASSDADLLLDDVRRARGAYPLDSDTVALLDRILETFSRASQPVQAPSDTDREALAKIVAPFLDRAMGDYGSGEDVQDELVGALLPMLSRTSQPVQVERSVSERIFDLFDELTSTEVEALMPAYFKTGEDARAATGVTPAQPVQVEVTEPEVEAAYRRYVEAKVGHPIDDAHHAATYSTVEREFIRAALGGGEKPSCGVCGCVPRSDGQYWAGCSDTGCECHAPDGASPLEFESVTLGGGEQ